MTLGSILIDDKVITQDQLDAANAQCGASDRLDQVLVRLGYCGEMDVLSALGKLYHFDVVDLTDASVVVDVETMKKMPSKLVHRAKLVPLNRDNGTIRVATRDPFQIYAFDELRMITGLDVRPVLAKESEINEIIKKHFGVGGDTISKLVEDNDSIAVVSDVRESAGDSMLRRGAWSGITFTACTSGGSQREPFARVPASW